MEMIDNRFRVIKKIYSSEIADSYVTEDIENNNELVDVKLLISNKYISNILFNMFKIESIIIKDLDFKGLPKYISHNEVDKEENYFYVASKHIGGLSLKTLLTDKPDFIKDNFFHIIYELINILEYLENKNIKHKSISLENVLVDENLNVSLVNFAAITNKLNSGREIEPIIGDFKFMPNEQKLGYVNLKSDQYAFGFLLLLLLVSDRDLSVEELRTEFNSLVDINQNLKDFVNIFIDKDATQRFLTIKHAKEIFIKIKNNEDLEVTSGHFVNEGEEIRDEFLAKKILETERLYMDLQNGEHKKPKNVITKVFFYLAFIFLWFYLIYYILGELVKLVS